VVLRLAFLCEAILPASLVFLLKKSMQSINKNEMRNGWPNERKGGHIIVIQPTTLIHMLVVDTHYVETKKMQIKVMDKCLGSRNQRKINTMTKRK
jgi:hypothetical protein